MPDFKFVSTFIIGRHPDRSDVRVVAVVVGPEEIGLVDLAGMCCSEADSVEINGLVTVHGDGKSAEGYQDTKYDAIQRTEVATPVKILRASGSHPLAQ